MNPMNLRIGYGFDVHRLQEGYALMLGGIDVPHTKGSVGHSDADVLLHAICDAMLGAANLRDIGFHFPDTDPQYKGADSKALLKASYQKVKEAGFTFINLDSTICLQRPKVNPHIPKMQETIAACLECDVDRVSIKATTTEKLGFVGKEEGVSAHATVLLTR